MANEPARAKQRSPPPRLNPGRKAPRGAEGAVWWLLAVCGSVLVVVRVCVCVCVCVLCWSVWAAVGEPDAHLPGCPGGRQEGVRYKAHTREYPWAPLGGLSCGAG